MDLEMELYENELGEDSDISFNVSCIINNPDDDGSVIKNAGEFIPLEDLVELDLGGNHLTSFLEIEDIRFLINLTHLNLYDNELTSIPESIGILRNLEHLRLDRNDLTTIPDSIGRLENLRYLNLNNNPIRYLPASICNLHLTNFLLNRVPEEEDEEDEDDEDDEDEEEEENEEDEIVPVDQQILLYPLQDEYIFENAHVLNAVRRVFNINEYNRLMALRVFRENDRKLSSTRRYAVASTKYHAKKISRRKKYVDHISTFLDSPMQLQQNPPSSKVFMGKRFMNHLASFTKENYIPKTVREVLLLRE